MELKGWRERWGGIGLEATKTPGNPSVEPLTAISPKPFNPRAFFLFLSSSQCPFLFLAHENYWNSINRRVSVDLEQNIPVVTSPQSRKKY